MSRSETFGLASAPAPEPAPVPAATAPESAPVLFLELVFFPVQVRFLTGGGGWVAEWHRGRAFCVSVWGGGQGLDN